MDDLAVAVILGLCSFRVTRFIVDDTLWAGTRDRFLAWLDRPKVLPLWRYKLLQLLECYWCVGVWVSAVVVCVWSASWPWTLGRVGWITVAAVAGIQAVCASIIWALDSPND